MGSGTEGANTLDAARSALDVVAYSLGQGTMQRVESSAQQEEAVEVEAEESGRKGCYASPVPEGRVKLTVVEPSLGLDTALEGTLRPRFKSGAGNGLNPARLKYEGARSGRLRAASGVRDDRDGDRRSVLLGLRLRIGPDGIGRCRVRKWGLPHLRRGETRGANTPRRSARLTAGERA